MPAKSTSTATRRTARTPPATATRGARSPAATARRRKPAARSRPPTSPNDAIALLKGDHRRVAAMFLQFDRMKADGSRKEALVAKICQELTVHARVEEEIFYPAARSVLENAALIDEADVEHASAKALIAELRSAKPGDDHYDAKVKVLGEYVRHHVKEEQDELFPKLRRTALDMVVLGERMAARKHELAALFANPAATEDAMRRFIPIV